MATRRRRKWRRPLWVAAGVIVLGVLAWCVVPYLVPPKPTTLAPLDPSSGHLLHVTGWNGAVQGDRDLLHALRDAGVPFLMETFDWTNGHRGLMALWHAQRSSQPAEQLRDRLIELHRADPQRPLYLTADSSGCGVVLSAIASLPAGVSVERVILASPAVSPDFDLRPALDHVQSRLISLNSTGDFAILTIGTTLFGTVDRKHRPAAGRGGFTMSSPKLVQVSYDESWRSVYGHNGSHAQYLSPRFARAKIAPMLLER